MNQRSVQLHANRPAVQQHVDALSAASREVEHFLNECKQSMDDSERFELIQASMLLKLQLQAVFSPDVANSNVVHQLCAKARCTWILLQIAAALHIITVFYGLAGDSGTGAPACR